VNKWKTLAAQGDGSTSFDLTTEIGEIFSRIIITICFGEDLNERMMPIEKEDGSVEQMSISTALRVLLQQLFSKAGHPLRGISTKLFLWALNSTERLTRKNCNTLRAFVRDYARERQAGKN